MTAERLGVPAFSVMTARFVSAADMMSRVLGMPDYAFARIGHPVSSATDGAGTLSPRTALSRLLLK